MISLVVKSKGKRPIVPERDKRKKILQSTTDIGINIPARIMVGKIAFSCTCHPSKKYKKVAATEPTDQSNSKNQNIE